MINQASWGLARRGFRSEAIDTVMSILNESCARAVVFLACLLTVPACARLLGTDFDSYVPLATSAEGGGPGGDGAEEAQGSGDDQGGGGGAPSKEPLLGSACTKLGTYRCNAAAQNLRVLCDGEHWREGELCAEGELCSRVIGACTRAEPRCASHGPGATYCDADAVVACGPDAVEIDTTVLESCAGRCVMAEGAKCLDPYCGDGKPQAGEDCDDGNTEDSDDCLHDCRSARCGDGFVQRGIETCDPNEAAPNETCTATCSLRAVELAPGQEHTCARLFNGRVKCWGDGEYGVLGLGDGTSRGDEPGEMAGSLPFVDLGKNRTVRQLSSGSRHTCAVLDDGSVKCWGSNDVGQLGLGDVEDRGLAPLQMGDALPPVSLGSGRQAHAVAAGLQHTCALLEDGKIKCWGGNASGQLGLGDTRSRGIRPGELGDALPEVDLGSDYVATALAVGPKRSCAILADGRTKCWGDNDFGALGLGDWKERGMEPGEMGEMLNAVELGTGLHAKSLALADHTSCALLDDDSVKCWGDKLFGSGIVGSNPGEMGDRLPRLDFGGAVVAISASYAHACALLQSGMAKCWGFNGLGQLGLGDRDKRGDDPQETPGRLPGLDLGRGRSIRAIFAGWNHTCALLDNAELRCWGGNDHGQLGLGDTENRGDSPIEVGDAMPSVRL